MHSGQQPSEKESGVTDRDVYTQLSVVEKPSIREEAQRLEEHVSEPKMSELPDIKQMVSSRTSSDSNQLSHEVQQTPLIEEELRGEYERRPGEPSQAMDKPSPVDADGGVPSVVLTQEDIYQEKSTFTIRSQGSEREALEPGSKAAAVSVSSHVGPQRFLTDERHQAAHPSASNIMQGRQPRRTKKVLDDAKSVQERDPRKIQKVLDDANSVQKRQPRKKNSTVTLGSLHVNQ